MDLEFTQAQEELQTRFDELPEEIMDVIVGGTLDAVVFGITQTYSLTQEQVDSLENEIIFVLSFFIDRSAFVDNMQESLGVDRRTAEAIGAEVQTEIFELVEEYFEAVESAKEEQAEEGDKQIIAKKVEQKTDLQRLAEQFAEKSKLAQSQSASMVPSVEQTVTQQNVATTEQETLEKVQPLRTMQSDISRIHGYGAYNEMLEKDDTTHTSNQDESLGK